MLKPLVLHCLNILQLLTLLLLLLLLPTLYLPPPRCPTMQLCPGLLRGAQASLVPAQYQPPWRTPLLLLLMHMCLQWMQHCGMWLTSCWRGMSRSRRDSTHCR